MSRAEKAAQKIFRPIDKGVVNLVTKQELIDYQNLRMEQKKQYIAGYEQAEKDTIERACEWMEKNIRLPHPRKGTNECIVNLNVFREAMEESK